MTRQYKAFLVDLKKLARRARDEGYSFAASVEYPSAKTTQTADIHVTHVSAAQMLAHYAVRADGNLDALCIAAARGEHRPGHTSVVLRLMGVKP